MAMLAVIPARGGSKGVPHKNILDINGKKLIEFSIEVGLQAKNRGLIDELIVSTDDLKIKEISEDAGASVPFIRPDYLSNDTAKTVDVLIHAVDFFKDAGKVFDDILLLQPTAPLRTVEDIQNAVEIYKTSGLTSLISCYKEEYICNLVCYYKQENKAIALDSGHNTGGRRQELPDIYVRNGAIYITSVKQMLENHRVFDDIPAMYVMPKERSVNIDSLDDVEMLKWRCSR